MHLVEQGGVLGGAARRLLSTYKGEDVKTFLARLTAEIQAEPKVAVHLHTSVSEVQGFVGNFKTTLLSGDASEIIEHGVAILATGAKEYKPQEYLYGEHPGGSDPTGVGRTFATGGCPPGSGRKFRVYSMRGFPGRKPSLLLEGLLHPLGESGPGVEAPPADANVTILYRDMRTYGPREDLYTAAREQGVLFSRYPGRTHPWLPVRMAV